MNRMTNHYVEMELWTRGMDRLISSIFRYEHGTTAPWRPPTDVYETNDDVVIKVEAAGIDPKSFEILFADRIMQIRGKRVDTERKNKSHCLEIQYGEFLSEVYLPGHYLEEKIKANYENGFLRITLPKAPPEQPQTIAVHSSDLAIDATGETSEEQ